MDGRRYVYYNPGRLVVVGVTEGKSVAMGDVVGEVPFGTESSLALVVLSFVVLF